MITQKFIHALVACLFIAPITQAMEQRNPHSLKLLAADKVAKNKSAHAIQQLPIANEIKELILNVKEHQHDLHQSKYFDILLKIAQQPTANITFLEDLEKVLGADFYGSDEKKNQLLLLASSNGNINLIDWLIKMGANPNQVAISPDNNNEDTPLLRATARRHAASAEFLLENRADVNYENKWNHTALGNSIANNDTRLFRLLLQNKAKITGIANPPLFCAAHYGRNEMIKILLEHGAPIEERGLFGNTPLLEACEQGQISTIDLLLQHNANIQSLDDFGNSALMKALSISNHEARENTIKFLFEKGAASLINTPNHQVATPLFHATRYASLQLIINLLNRGAAINVQDAQGRNILFRLILNIHEDGKNFQHNRLAENIKILKFLISCDRTLINHQDALGETPLIYAIRLGFSMKGLWQVMQVLLEEGADINARDNSGNAALDYAIQERLDHVIQLLVRYQPQMSLNNRLTLFYHNNQGYIFGSATLGTAFAGLYFLKNNGN